MVESILQGLLYESLIYGKEQYDRRGPMTNEEGSMSFFGAIYDLLRGAGTDCGDTAANPCLRIRA